MNHLAAPVAALWTPIFVRPPVPQSSGQRFGASAWVEYSGGYPVTENHPAETTFIADVAAGIVGEEQVARDVAPLMAAEDFSYMLEHRPGAYIFLGNGDSAGLHHSDYDFCDAASPYGASLWARLIETGLPVRG